MTNVNGVAQVELLNQLVYVCRVSVHLVAGVRLGLASMSTPIMSDDAKSLVKKEHHLAVPVVSGQGPTMVKEERLSFAPVLVIDLRSVLRCDCAHSSLLYRS